MCSSDLEFRRVLFRSGGDAYELLVAAGASTVAVNAEGKAPELIVEPPSKFDNCCVM